LFQVAEGGGEKGDVVGWVVKLGGLSSVGEFLSVSESELGLVAEKELEVRLWERVERLREEARGAREAREPALFLHVALLLIFALRERALLDVSGKFVPEVVGVLEGKVGPEGTATLRRYTRAVVEHIKTKGQSGDLEGIYDQVSALIDPKYAP
jgi:hypothetical protein